MTLIAVSTTRPYDSYYRGQFDNNRPRAARQEAAAAPNVALQFWKNRECYVLLSSRVAAMHCCLQGDWHSKVIASRVRKRLNWLFIILRIPDTPEGFRNATPGGELGDGVVGSISCRILQHMIKWTLTRSRQSHGRVAQA